MFFCETKQLLSASDTEVSKYLAFSIFMVVHEEIFWTIQKM